MPRKVLHPIAIGPTTLYYREPKSKCKQEEEPSRRVRSHRNCSPNMFPPSSPPKCLTFILTHVTAAPTNSKRKIGPRTLARECVYHTCSHAASNAPEQLTPPHSEYAIVLSKQEQHKTIKTKNLKPINGQPRKHTNPCSKLPSYTLVCFALHQQQLPNQTKTRTADLKF